MLHGQEKHLIDVPIKTEAQNEWVEYLADVHKGPRHIILILLALLGWKSTHALHLVIQLFLKMGKTQEADWSQENGNRRIEERTVWSYVEKQHYMFYTRPTFPLKTRKKK